MSFHLLIKFDPSQDTEQIALDYGVLGAENFQAIIDAYNNSGITTYATRDDLGGVGNVDYLIVPKNYIKDNVDLYKSKHHRPLGYLQKGEDLYYIPLNLVMFWNSPYFFGWIRDRESLF